MRFKIDWASLIVGGKFTVFALFYFVFEGNFQVQAPGGIIFGRAIYGGSFALPVWGAYIWKGLSMEGPIHEGAYFRNFTVDCFFNYGESIWWWKKAGGGWLSLKDQNFGGNNVHCCRPRKSVFRVQLPDIYNRPSPSSKNPPFLNDGKPFL